MTLTPERQQSLADAYAANIAAGNAPYADVAIRNQEELAWIFEVRGWSSAWFLPEGKTGADLRGANLTDADLRGADLTRADLRGADLTRADLTDADLTDANLTDADLRGANLTDANLTDADLRGANLTDADLRGANLTRADLTDADLRSVEADIIAALDAAPLDTEYLLHALEVGEVDGSMYEEPGSPCACLKGTQVISAAKRLNCSLAEAADKININKNAGSPAERWFMAIRPGDTPENSTVVAWTVNVVKQRLVFYDVIARTWTPRAEEESATPTTTGA